ncbi:cation diffusion facilitator CzcD-associated flavoprotein CzcO [Pseudarthrobacter niigatensis]|uniref:Cation diffusion facilitator CzcD-associated flavoprotein CzcO n=1 Tax=Pseudarthrobacter niigatensis TaxID=369935 RepID=A0AAJ1SX37_9MICC|nr:cation diffusion facilitator CzcD-associated flavoprotein CzcO [Pseudarthrobacter niigatensis]MDQ0267744.1 cation diffusion facilitator CzcD-associated flavoprotein CzcO [Pseudarthrobacter niigatensis]
MNADAVVVGAGPNGLAAAVTLARSGLKMRMIEGAQRIGSGTRTTELTLPGFRHDLIEEHAPKFRDVILATHSITAWQFSQYDLTLAGTSALAPFPPANSSNVQDHRGPWRTPAKGGLSVFLLNRARLPGPWPLRLVRRPICG